MTKLPSWGHTLYLLTFLLTYLELLCQYCYTLAWRKMEATNACKDSVFRVLIGIKCASQYLLQVLTLYIATCWVISVTWTPISYNLSGPFTFVGICCSKWHARIWTDLICCCVTWPRCCKGMAQPDSLFCDLTQMMQGFDFILSCVTWPR